MLCLLEMYLPVEIIIRILQLLDDEEDIPSLIMAYPSLLKNYPLISEFITSRTTLEMVVKETGISVINKNKLVDYIDYFDYTKIKSIHFFNLKIKEREMKLHKFIPFASISVMIGLQRVKLVHENGGLMVSLLDILPISVIVLEIVLDGTIKDKWKLRYQRNVDISQQREYTIRECRIRQRTRNLKMITIINLTRKNRKKVDIIKTKQIAKQIEVEGPNVIYSNIIQRSVGNRHEHKMIYELGMAIALLIEESKNTIQNIGIFGIDAIWIMGKVGYEFPALRVIKTGGESMTRSILWADKILSKNRQKKIFLHDHYARPMVVLFGKMFNGQCKVYLSENRTYYITGTGIKLFEEFTYI